jgi:hypothetical protein
MLSISLLEEVSPSSLVQDSLFVFGAAVELACRRN